MEKVDQKKFYILKYKIRNVRVKQHNLSGRMNTQALSKNGLNAN